MTVKQVLFDWLVERGLADPAGPPEKWLDDRWYRLPLGGRPVRVFPLLFGLKESVTLHDLHHLVSGYDTSWRGEHEVAAWEIGSGGCGWRQVVTYPPADQAYRAKNPTGKYPCLETEDGTFLGESKVILNYLEDAYPDVPLLPVDPLERARVRELMEIIDLYLELPARRLYPEVFSSVGKVSDEVKSTVRPVLAQGVAALKELARFDPYIAGPELSLADFSATFHFVPVSIASKAIYGENVLAALPAVKRHRDLMDRRELVQRVRAEQIADQQAFMQRPTT